LSQISFFEAKKNAINLMAFLGLKLLYDQVLFFRPATGPRPLGRKHL